MKYMQHEDDGVEKTESIRENLLMVHPIGLTQKTVEFNVSKQAKPLTNLQKSRLWNTLHTVLRITYGL